MRAIFNVLLLTSTVLSAADWSSLYDTASLEKQGPRLRHDVDLVIAQEIQPFLTVEQAHAFSQIQLELPLTAPPEPNPFDCYSPGEGRLILPLLTVAFVEDMAEAYSWLWANRYSSRTVDEYLGMLRNRSPGDFPGNRYPSPLVALHIPADARRDPAVAKMTERVRGTTLSFMLLHQFGHSRYRTAAEESALRHEGMDGDEERADAFALEVMKKNSETPAGLLMLIHGMMYLPAVAPKNHPLSNGRLREMANFLDTNIREFSDGRPNRQLTSTAIRSLASHIRQSAAFLSDTAGQELWAEQSRKTTIADLAPRHFAE